MKPRYSVKEDGRKRSQDFLSNKQKQIMTAYALAKALQFQQHEYLHQSN
jgi:hypothetical protein